MDNESVIERRSTGRGSQRCGGGGVEDDGMRTGDGELGSLVGSGARLTVLLAGKVFLLDAALAKHLELGPWRATVSNHKR